MENNILRFIEKIKNILFIFKSEYDTIIKLYEKNEIYNKSLPIKATKKCNLEQKSEIDNYIKDIFFPTFETISDLIDSGLIELDSMSPKVEFSKNTINKDIISELIYESWDKLYIYKYTKYNIVLSFIMQMYLIFEKELVYFTSKNIQEESNSVTLFSALKSLESSFNISPEIKNALNKYRNIINVYKHGNGESFNQLKEHYPDILNTKETTLEDTSFVFNLDMISVNDLYKILTSLLDNFVS